MKKLIIALLLTFVSAQASNPTLTHARLIVEQAAQQFPNDTVIKAILAGDSEAVSATHIEPHNFFQISIAPEKLPSNMPKPEGYNGSIYAFDYLGLALLMSHETFTSTNKFKQMHSFAVVKALVDSGCTPNTTYAEAHFVNGLDYICFTPIMFLTLNQPETLTLLLVKGGRAKTVNEQREDLLSQATNPESKQLLLAHLETQIELPAITYAYSTGASSEGTPRNMWKDGKLTTKECSCDE